jgi:hypothetical protein
MSNSSLREAENVSGGPQFILIWLYSDLDAVANRNIHTIAGDRTAIILPVSTALLAHLSRIM